MDSQGRRNRIGSKFRPYGLFSLYGRPTAPPGRLGTGLPSEAELLAALARGDADIAAGRRVPASVVHEELNAAIERIEVGRAQRNTTARRR